MKLVRLVLAAASLAFGIVGAANAQVSAPIKVGVIIPLSGGAGPQGQHVTQAIQVMAALINESGGVMGRPIEIITRDDESTPAVGVSRANDLIAQGVSVIIEGWNSPFPFTQADFRVALTNVRAAEPDVTVAINANEGLGMPAIIRQFKQGRLPGQLLAALGTVAPSVISVAGDAANGVMGVDIYFPDVEPFTSNAVNRNFVARTQTMCKQTPDKFMAVGATALQLWAMAANELKTLDREAIAQRIRGGNFRNTVFGDVSFAPTGQLLSRTHLFKVNDGKIVVQK